MKKYDKILLISRIMDSYRLEQPNISDASLVEKFDRLYDMETSALTYLAELRKIKNIKETFVEY